MLIKLPKRQLVVKATKKIELSLIKNVPETGLNEDQVRKYISLIKQGSILEPILVKKSNGGYWLKDGAHRIAAYKRCNVLCAHANIC